MTTDAASIAAAYPSMSGDAPAPTPTPTTDADAQLAAVYPSMVPAPRPEHPAPGATREAPAATTPQPTPQPPPTAPQTETATLPGAGIDVKFPQGSAPDPATLGAFGEIAADLQLDGPAAQRLLDLHLAATEQLTSTADEAWSEAKAEWRDALSRDAEIGGAALKENVALARSVVTRYGTPELRRAFDELGIGDHPELVRFVVRVGKALAAKGTAAPAAAPASEDARLRAAYPSMFK